MPRYTYTLTRLCSKGREECMANGKPNGRPCFCTEDSQREETKMNLAQQGLWRKDADPAEFAEWADTAFDTSLGHSYAPKTMDVDPYWHPLARLQLGRRIAAQAEEQIAELAALERPAP